MGKRCYTHPVPPLPKYLTQDELKRFFAAIGAPRNKALCGLIYHYGLRVGEALMLTVDDVNFQTHRLTIRRLKNDLSGEKPLWQYTAKLLRRYLRERRDTGPYRFCQFSRHRHQKTLVSWWGSGYAAASMPMRGANRS
jgi:integrase